MIFNPYALIDLIAAIVAFFLASVIYKNIHEKKLKIIAFHLYIIGGLLPLFEFLAESLKLNVYKNLIITLIELEIFSGILCLAFVFCFITQLIEKKLSKFYYLLLFSYPVLTFFSLIFYPHQFIITGIKIVLTGYFGIYGFFTSTIGIIYAVFVSILIFIMLISSLHKKNKSPIVQNRIKYLLPGMLICYAFCTIYLILQAFLNFYYFSVGSISGYTIFLIFLFFILINRDFSNFGNILKSKILYPLLFTLMTGFFVLIFFLLKKAWFLFTQDESILSYIILLIFSVIYMFPPYNYCISSINKFLYKTELSFIESSQVFSALTAESINSASLRQNLWAWLENNFPVKHLTFCSINNNIISIIKSFGEPNYKLNTTTMNHLKMAFKKEVPLNPFFFFSSEFIFIIKSSFIPPEAILIQKLFNKPFTRREQEILKLILMNFKFIYENFYLREQVINKNKMTLLTKLSSNFNTSLNKIKNNLYNLQETISITRPTLKVKDNMIKNINKIISFLKIKV